MVTPANNERQGHLLWNAARVTTDYIEDHATALLKGKTVLELGAGAGLPSLFCALHGARRVVVTDYPDEELVRNLDYNIQYCCAGSDNGIVAEGYVWGQSVEHLLAHLDDSPAAAVGRGFDLLILADLLFNHSEHRKLVLSVQTLLKRTSEAVALVFFTPHRPWLFDKDLAFFELARNGGFVVKKVLERKVEKMVAEGPVRVSARDGGDEPERRIVFGYELRWGDLT